LLLLVGGVAGAIITRYAFPLQQPVNNAPAPKADFQELARKWSYPGSKVVYAGSAGAFAYYVIATTPDDIESVAAHYRPLLGADFMGGEKSGGGGGVSMDGSSWVAVTESWSAGEPRPTQRLTLGARAEAGCMTTVVLYRGAGDGLTRLAITSANR
jgi:hypothetical protein